MSKQTLDINQTEWETEVLNSDIPVLVDFWATWCSACKMLAPIIDQLADEYAGTLRVVKVEAHSNPDLIARYTVMSLPTMMLFKDGEVVDRMIGYKPKAKILEKLAMHLQEVRDSA